MQRLMKAAKEGTRDGLEKTKAAVKRGRSFIRTKSLVSQGLEPIFACSTDSREEAAWKVPTPPSIPPDLGLSLLNEGWFALKIPHVATEYGDSLAKCTKSCTGQNQRIKGVVAISRLPSCLLPRAVALSLPKALIHVLILW